MGDQFQIAVEHHSRGKQTEALRRFNLILLEEAHNAQPSFRYQALWYAGEIYRQNGDEKTALTIFLLHRRNRPNEMQEESLLNIATLLIEVKTGGFIGIGSTNYYDKAKALITLWLKKYNGGDRTPEALYTMGQCCEKLKQKEEAKEVYTKIKNEYPNSEFAAQAKKRLKKLNSWWGR
jgi:tetratricopeptide (TPR) repeat protein